MNPAEGGLVTADLGSKRLNLLVVDGKVRRPGVF